MKNHLLRFALLTVALAPAAAAFAADLEPPPPPVMDLRPASYDWSGAHVGVFVGRDFEEGHYNVTEYCDPVANPGCDSVDPGLSGAGWQGGIVAGYDKQFDNFVLGLEGDWARGGEVAYNNDPAQMTYMDFKNMITLRARAGMAFDDTLVYLTGGAAFIDSKFYSTDAPTGSGLYIGTHKWLTGWVVGGGVEHAFTDVLSGKMEYTYIGIPDAAYDLDNGVVAGRIDHAFDGVHTVRVGLNYRFGW